MSQAKSHILIPPKTQSEPSSMRLIFALGIAGLLSGIVLVGTFIYTNPMIEANKEAAMKRAIFNVLPDCASYKAMQVIDGSLVQKVEDEKKEEADKSELLVYAGYNQLNELIGFAIPGSEPGFQDVIGAIFGYDATQKVIIGFEVLESKETPGLGDKIFKDADFQTNFTSLVVDPEIVPVKNGEKQNPNEVEAITGATISSKAIVRLINNSMDIWQETIETYITQNQITIPSQNE